MTLLERTNTVSIEIPAAVAVTTIHPILEVENPGTARRRWPQRVLAGVTIAIAGMGIGSGVAAVALLAGGTF
jgi:hypothetical protein